MSLPNPEVYGTQETWSKCAIFYTIGDGDSATKTIAPRINVWDSESLPRRKGTLSRAIRAGKAEAGVPIDPTICPCGQDPAVSCFGKIALFKNHGNVDDNKVPDKVISYENSVNWFFSEIWRFPDGGRGFKPQFAERNDKVCCWAPDGILTDDTNQNRYITPFVYYQLKSIFASIYVTTITGYDNYGRPNTATVSLEDWKNSYHDRKIISATLRLKGVTSESGNIVYYGSGNLDPDLSVGVTLLNDVDGIIDYFTYYVDRQQYFRLFGDLSSNAYNSNNTYYMLGYDMFENMEVKSAFISGVTDGGWCVWQEVPYSEANYEMIMKMAACFGIPFSPTSKESFAAEFIDEDLYLPIIDENGIAHGEYTHGLKNIANPLYDMDGVRDINYDPAKPIKPTPSSDPITPFSPGLTLAGAGTGVYAMTKTGVKEFIRDVFGEESGKLKEKLSMFGDNPMNAVVSLKWYPMPWSSTENSAVILGTTVVNSSHTYPTIKTTASSLYTNQGTLNIMNAYKKNFYNSRNIQARLWLPFYGFYELPTSILLSKQIEVELHYNLPDDLAVWIISFDNVIYDFLECPMGIDVPLTGSNAAAIAEAKKQKALSIAAAVAGIAATAIGSAAGAWAGYVGSAALGAGAMAGAAPVLGAETAASWGYQVANVTKNFNFISQGAKAATGITNGAIGLRNTIVQSNRDIAALRTNVPFHSAAGETTFLNLPMKPYIQIFINTIMDVYNEAQYKLKVGHACDIWTTIDKMPKDSLLQATGIADSSTTNMELAEVQELNSILQSGFFR